MATRVQWWFRYAHPHAPLDPGTFHDPASGPCPAPDRQAAPL